MYTNAVYMNSQRSRVEVMMMTSKPARACDAAWFDSLYKTQVVPLGCCSHVK